MTKKPKEPKKLTSDELLRKVFPAKVRRELRKEAHKDVNSHEQKGT